MQKIEFKSERQQELIKAIIDKMPSFSRYDIESLVKNKDVKVNNIRQKENCKIDIDDIITVYYNEKINKEYFNILYADDNLLIVNKSAGIEVISETERDLLSFIKLDYQNVRAVHRIDRNTEGLVIFALNEKSENELNIALKQRKSIIKNYILEVHGKVDVNKIKRTVYLKKIERLSKVWISEIKSTSYEPIVTEFDVYEYKNKSTLLTANLITGKTHQIRAHISYYGHPILGDQKYGKDECKQLHLTAYSLNFDFKKDSFLSYMNKKTFEILPTWIEN